MAKKTRRPNIPEETLERARRQMGQDQVAPATTAAASGGAMMSTAKRRSLSSADLRTEYAYVVRDLQSMGILAAAFLVVLIALSFFI